MYFLIIIFNKTFVLFGQGYNAIVSCSNSGFCYLGYFSIFFGFGSFVLLMPFFIRELSKFILIILALLNSKQVGIIKRLFYIDILCQKFYNIRDFYIFEFEKRKYRQDNYIRRKKEIIKQNFPSY